MFSYVPLYMCVQVLDDQTELIYNSSVQTQNVVSQKWWLIETNGKRESGKSMLVAQYDDYDDFLSKNFSYLNVFF